MADIDSRDMFFYSRKADIAESYKKACTIDKARADQIMKSNMNLINKVSALEDMVSEVK